MNERTILHSDVNNFFASVECKDKPQLKNQPVAVTGNPEKRTGIILAKNDVAKSFGIKTGQTIFEAQKLCPNLVCLPPHYNLYEQISKQLHQIYLQYTNLVEPMGLDECWLDVTDSLKILNKTGEQIAYEIKEKIKNQFGITVSVGVSFSKIYAKLGSDLKKPDAVTVITKSNFKKINIFLSNIKRLQEVGTNIAIFVQDIVTISHVLDAYNKNSENTYFNHTEETANLIKEIVMLAKCTNENSTTLFITNDELDNNDLLYLTFVNKVSNKL